MVSITLFMIVKNESSIIERCLNSVKKHVDYIVISDTGSTDNTVEIINNYLTENNIKGKVYTDKWKNFGYNRTKSIINSYEWLDEQKIDRETNYLVTIDADMIINFSDSFNKDELLKYDYWNVCQYNSSIRYYNSRFFKASIPFKCVSVTHEYWSSIFEATQGKIESVSIDDRGDGGCKQDKFERDISLLKKGLEDEPNNHRYYFYLAQSYADTGNYEHIDEAIKWYKKRIDAGGWYEEVFISYKRLGELYLLKGEDEKALYYWILAYETIPERSETIHKICNYYRNKGKNNACLIYIKIGLRIPYPNDLLLFLEYPVYNYKFIEELSIVGYYTDRKKEGLLACQYIILNKTDDIPDFIRDSTFSNNFFYINPIKSICKSSLKIDTREPYISSSPCLIYNDKEEKYQGIVRAVNYSITDKFEYRIRDKNNTVCTINYWTEFDKNFNNISQYEIDCKTDKIRNSHIKGLEDIRICILEGKVYGIVVDWEHCEHHHPSILLTHLDLVNGKYIINTVFPITYKNNICQKNWTLFTENSKMYALYSHHPLTILEINPEDGDYKIIKEQYSDYNLKDIRGSANPIKIGDDWLVLVHEVVHKDTRKYYHRFLKYSRNWDLLDISEPFYFKELFVEFSLSISHRIIRRDNSDIYIINIFYSSRDNTSDVLSLEYQIIPWLPHNIKKYLIEVL